MSFEIFEAPRQRRSAERTAEIIGMLEILEAEPESMGRIEMDRANLYNACRNLGYKVTITDNKDGTCNVQIRGKV